MSVYAWHENASSSTTVGDTDMVPLYVAGTGAPTKLPYSVLAGAGHTPVNATAGATALALTVATHGNRTVTLNNTAPIAITLPASAGTGAIFKILVQVSATATSSTIKVANGTDIMQGVTISTTTNAGQFPTTATSDTVSLNGGSQGGTIGTYYEFEDVKTGFWRVTGFDTSAVTATMYSASVS